MTLLLLIAVPLSFCAGIALEYKLELFAKLFNK